MMEFLALVCLGFMSEMQMMVSANKIEGEPVEKLMLQNSVVWRLKTRKPQDLQGRGRALEMSKDSCCDEDKSTGGWHLPLHNTCVIKGQGQKGNDGPRDAAK
ncbi:hypothetical protein QBC45DRAFT_187316 [Copromyces sp. CBS 386.78]|nr:hypothetical protein QBC45DRAFT_187316 [Copromyces sp. CBS 386.78]